jgi:hypothetical protein
MLTSEDDSTIRFALRWRLDGEPGANVLEPTLVQPIKRGEWYTDVKSQMDVQAREGFIRVVVEVKLGETIGVLSEFHLPDPFEHGHLVDEIDEIAESLKKVRKETFLSSLPGKRGGVVGTGARGNWDRYGTILGRHG